MAKRRPTLIHRLLCGSGGPENQPGVLFLVGGLLHHYTREGGLRRCPDSWAAHAVVVAGVDPALVLGLRRPDDAEAGPRPPSQPAAASCPPAGLDALTTPASPPDPSRP